MSVVGYKGNPFERITLLSHAGLRWLIDAESEADLLAREGKLRDTSSLGSNDNGIHLEVRKRRGRCLSADRSIAVRPAVYPCRIFGLLWSLHVVLLVCRVSVPCVILHLSVMTLGKTSGQRCPRARLRWDPVRALGRAGCARSSCPRSVSSRIARGGATRRVLEFSGSDGGICVSTIGAHPPALSRRLGASLLPPSLTCRCAAHCWTGTRRSCPCANISVACLPCSAVEALCTWRSGTVPDLPPCG